MFSSSSHALGETSVAATAARPKPTYAELLARLNDLSVKHWADPYTDIAWDDPDNHIDPDDERFCLSETHALARTSWYASLDARTRARFGLSWIAQQLKFGIGFEAILCRGLLQFCQTVPNGSPEYRYAMHEVIEEGRHSLMFQEFINRAGTETEVASGAVAWVDDRIAHLGRSNPLLFFFAVLAGEIFIDTQNRTDLKRSHDRLHPVYRQMLKIHVMEEARHVCFAERYLREHLPGIEPKKALKMGLLLPPVFYDAARMMLIPNGALVARFSVPRAVMREAFGRDSEFWRQFELTTRPLRQLCAEHGLMRAPHALLWKRFLPAGASVV